LPTETGVSEVAGRVAVGAAGVAGVQLVAAVGVVVLWHYTAHMWGDAALLFYFLGFCFLLPFVAFAVGRWLARKPGVSVFMVSPICLVNLVSAVGAHGFEDVGLGVASMLTAFTGLSFLAGWAALRHWPPPKASEPQE
jgi:hypothetical protein